MLVDVPNNQISSEIRGKLLPPGETEWVTDYTRIKESRGRVVGSSPKWRRYGESHGTECGQGCAVGMQRPRPRLPSCFYTKQTSPYDIDHRKMPRGDTSCTRRNPIYNGQGSRAMREEIGKENLRVKPLHVLSPRTSPVPKFKAELEFDFVWPLYYKTRNKTKQPTKLILLFSHARLTELYTSSRVNTWPRVNSRER